MDSGREREGGGEGLTVNGKATLRRKNPKTLFIFTKNNFKHASGNPNMPLPAFWCFMNEARTR